jgi:pimeloyl-ACP methyl ester carboxylesterase
MGSSHPEHLGHLDEGEGPVVVFLHGFTLDRTMWNEQVLALRSRYRVLAIDLPGHGSSKAVAGARSSARDTLELLDALCIERAIIIGSSLGGTVALDLAIERPALVQALVLLDPILLATGGGPSPEQAALVDLAQRGDLEGARARWLGREPFKATRENAPAALRLVAMVGTYQGGHWLGDVRDQWLHAPHNERLAELKMPIVVAAGAGGGPRGAAMAREIARLCPRSRFELLEHVGHLVAIEDPDRLTRLLWEALTWSAVES